MARRRSINRRSSRKSMNFTELDNDSELINRDNPLWWKNIESDITVRQSRRISSAETTAGILNSDSLVDPSELPDAWWDKLDKTNPNVPERVSSRPSNTAASILNDSDESDDIDHTSIKKRKVVLRTRSNKSEATDNFAKALVDADLAQSESLSTEKRKNPSDITSDTGVVRKQKGKLQHSSARNSPEGSDKDASGKTTDDSDRIVKARPLAFKKRSTKLDNDLFDDILRNEPIGGSSGISSVPKASRSRNSTISQSTIEPRAISFGANESGRSVDNRSEILQQVSDRDESELMQPPKAKLPRRKYPSVSTSRIVNSDDSDSDGILKKVRPAFGKKNLQKVSMNPFDEILNQSSDNENRESNDSVKKRRTSKHSASGNPNDSNRRPDSQISMSKSLRAEDSHSRRIDQGEDDASITGERSLRSTSKNRSLRSTSRNRSLRSPSRNRSLRSTSQSRMLKSINKIPDSAYELPARERSSPSFNQSVSRSSDRSLTQTKINELNKSKTPRRETRTMIFSDEDISVEDMSNGNESNQIFSQSISREDKVRRSRRSVRSKNKSLRRIQAVENNSEEEATDAELTNPKSSSSILKDKSRISRKSLAPANKSRSRIELDESIGEDEPDDVERTNPKSSSSILKVKPRISRKSLAPANKSRSRIELDESIGENERDDVERTNPKSSSSILKEKSRLYTVNRTSTNKSLQKTETVKSLSEAETEIVKRTDPDSSSSSSNEIYNASRKNLASTRKYRKHLTSVENETDDETVVEEETDPESSNSVMKDKSRTSRKFLVPTNESQRSAEYHRANSEDESDDAEKNDPKSSESLLKEKSRNSRKSLRPANKSQPREESDESSSEDAAKRAKSSGFPGKDHFQTSERNLVPVNKSRRRIESHEGVNESENEMDENPNRKSSSSHIGEKSGKSRKSGTPTDNVTDNADETTESGVSLSEAEITSTPNTNVSSNSELREKSHTSKKSVMPTIDSQPIIESGESISEQEVESSGSTNRSSLKSQLEESHVSVRSLGTTNKSRQIIESNKSISENEAEVENIEKTDRDQSDSHLKKKGDTSIRSLGPANKSFQASNEIDASRKISHRLNISSALEVVRSIEEKNAEDAEQTNQTNEGETSNRIFRSKNTSIERKATEHREPSLSKERNQEKNDASLAIPMGKTPRAQQMNNPSSKKINKSSANKTNVSESQKTIMDFFPSRFLQRSEHTRVHEAPTDFDKEKLILIKKKMDKIKSREIELLENDLAKKQKTELLIHSIPATKGKLRGKKNATSRPKKSGQVDTIVYRPPKLVRPQLWATDRLYRHLWKRMEPTCQMATRRKSIKFVQQLSQIVSLTIRRKKYDNYKLQVQALMNEMARLNIIKTRNDFYDFCYDFLPYEFRVKVTPIFLPGNTCSIPYNPKKLHAPILSGGED